LSRGLNTNRGGGVEPEIVAGRRMVFVDPLPALFFSLVANVVFAYLDDPN
jgi:hypothetical protein